MKTVIALLVAALLTAACSSPETASTESSGEADTASTESAGETGPASVTVVDFAFEPETIQVSAGDEVTWTLAEESSDHTVKFDDEESDVLSAGDSYSRTFDEAGQFDYVCGIHPQMTGTVAVE